MNTGFGKMFMKGASAVLGASALLMSAAAAQSFDVADLKLGMTQADVEATMASQGYEPHNKAGRSTHITKQATFAQAVQQSLGEYIPRKQHEGVQAIFFQKGDSRQLVAVSFTEFPSGAFVTEISYVLQDKSFTVQEFSDRIRQKYGAPDSSQNIPAQSTWVGDQGLTRDNISYDESLIQRSFGLTLKGRVKRNDMRKAIQEARPEATADTDF